MDPKAALDAAARALDAEDYDEAIDRLFDYYQYRAKAMTVANDGDRIALEYVRAERLTTRAQDMRDRFTEARELSDDEQRKQEIDSLCEGTECIRCAEIRAKHLKG